MQIGIDSFGAIISDPATGVTLSPVQRMDNLLEEIVLADQTGLDVFGIGEHHRTEFVDSAPPVILAAAATRTTSIRLTSAVTVLSAADPVRIFQEFATLDLISHGRAEIVAGRGSSIEAFPLFGFALDDYDSLFSEKLDLLLKIRENVQVRWSGRHRPPLTGQAVYPRPLQNPLPIWVGVGGTPESFARAGTLGLPLMVAIIGGEPKRFRPLIDLYREAGRRAGHSAEKLVVGLHAIGFLGDTTEQAAEDFYPGYAHTFTRIGKERGWPPTTRAQFDAVRGPTGALLIGDPETVAEKVLYVNEVLGGLSRITFQMGVSALPHEKMLRSIELLGTRVAPLVREDPPFECSPNTKKGTSSHELGRSLGLTQKTAWFMLQRIRHAMSTGTFEEMSGEVEADEDFIGQKA
jgi:probable LLM family oxidoreductase